MIYLLDIKRGQFFGGNIFHMPQQIQHTLVKATVEKVPI